MIKANVMYRKLEELLNPKKKISAPSKLDCICINFRGVNVDVYGVLHGLTGGTNKEYVKLVNHTIFHSRGVRFCEKSMKSIYKHLDVDVNDWIPMNMKEVFSLSFFCSLNPFFLYRLIKTLIREMLNKHNQKDYSLPSSLSGSPRFHLIDPTERRIFAGFPLPEEYLRLNLGRRNGEKSAKFYFTDPDWGWLTSVEPYSCIPLRSIHMIEYVVEYALKHDITECSLFIGEIHNSDIAWYVDCVNNRSVPEDLFKAAEKVSLTARDAVHSSFVLKKFKYFSALIFGTLAGFSSYSLLLFMYLIFN